MACPLPSALKQTAQGHLHGGRGQTREEGLAAHLCPSPMEGDTGLSVLPTLPQPERQLEGRRAQHRGAAPSPQTRLHPCAALSPPPTKWG